MSFHHLIDATTQLAADCQHLTFSEPVTHVYHPLEYAHKAHREYLRRFANTSKRVIFLGMNPGPWGMAQTGIPFGEVAAVRDWMRIKADISSPEGMHPARPVLGFSCPRSEVSGRRLWGLFAQRYGEAPAFFANHLVLNYCPLLFLSANDKRCANITPDKLRIAEKEPLFKVCDTFLYHAVDILQPRYLIGIGGFAEKRLFNLFAGGERVIGKILHPSPASPAANRGFMDAAIAQLRTLGVW